MRELQVMKFCIVTVLFSLSVAAFTPAETNQVAESLLRRVLLRTCDANLPEEGRIVPPETRVDTWETFIGFTQAPGWSFDDKKSAFDWYLSTLGTKDCRELTYGQGRYVLAAVSQCYELGYTNAVPHLQALALNPYGTYREYAIENAIRLGRVNDGMTSFVNSIVTNLVGFSKRERESAFAEYADKVVAMTNGCSSVERLNAGRMFYGNRFVSSVGEYSIDQALVSCFPQYETSSNRFQTANWVLAQDDCHPRIRSYFVSITNQLLSSGRPLQWIDVGTNE